MHEYRPSETLPARVPANLADDLLHGAEAIACFVFGDAKYRRKIYHYATDAKLRMPTFRIGNVICARKSKLLEWIEIQETSR